MPSNANSRSIKLHCDDAAASHAENVCKLCLASPVDIFWSFVFRFLWNDSTGRIQYAKHVLYSFNRRKRNFHSWRRNLLQTGNVDQELSSLVIKLTNLRRKIIQRSIFSERDLFSSSSFLRVKSMHAYTWQWRHCKWNAPSTTIKKILEEFNCRYQWV